MNMKMWNKLNLNRRGPVSLVQCVSFSKKELPCKMIFKIAAYDSDSQWNLRFCYDSCVANYWIPFIAPCVRLNKAFQDVENFNEFLNNFGVLVRIPTGIRSLKRFLMFRIIPLKKCVSFKQILTNICRDGTPPHQQVPHYRPSNLTDNCPRIDIKVSLVAKFYQGYAISVYNQFITVYGCISARDDCVWQVE